MDPVTAGLNLATKLLEFSLVIYKDTPQATREANAENWGKFIHNIGNTILDWQNKLTNVAK